mmetsp:Transcript_45879/g.139339  ORF Transcript_45879/g.139339 Transcript_45879/m.139339 type:complete len:202 (-) Transcript_45879:479-1084(-)|eukprot:CAMPEP_0113558932 /NCGR_PEP_ID=MMETSP0015_2-20120614/18621_1 /TAXON_ID=2838 /ORGANISM="Odontella" /LENGTH=201 /DNA_ID=CAMNT_0000460523 /DNA_START=170 /DNA_END=775 /DNA_ORIENTATION=- /assembly_acc=CAM_ASM_000160
MPRYSSSILASSWVLATLLDGTNAFCTSGAVPNPCTTEIKSSLNANSEKGCTSRRSAFGLIAGASSMFIGLQTAGAVEEDLQRGGVVLTPFNSLTFNYRGGGFTGLDASTLDEPSIPFQGFLDKLNANEVEFVEFMAPDGDAAYATFKANSDGEKPTPIRIGEGFPIEQHDGWSSPAFVVKALNKKEVPYKFTVPGLAAYK